MMIFGFFGLYFLARCHLQCRFLQMASQKCGTALCAFCFDLDKVCMRHNGASGRHQICGPSSRSWHVTCHLFQAKDSYSRVLCCVVHAMGTVLFATKFWADYVVLSFCVCTSNGLIRTFEFKPVANLAGCLARFGTWVSQKLSYLNLCLWLYRQF